MSNEFLGAMVSCSMCSTAIMDRLVPPALAWGVIGPTWMLLSGALGTIHRSRVPGNPRILISLALLVLGGYLAASSLGTMVAVFFYIPPIRAFAAATWGASARYDNPNLRRDIRRLGFLATIAIVVTASVGVHTYLTRSDGEFVVRWGGTGPARTVLLGLDPQDPASLPDYRYVVEHGPRIHVCSAAARIAEIGDRSDIDLLSKAIVPANRLGCEPWNRNVLKSLERLKVRLQEADSGKPPN